MTVILFSNGGFLLQLITNETRICSRNGLFVLFDHVNPGIELIYMCVSFQFSELGHFRVAK